jgi:virginiamycin A acetyltransferase
MPLPETLHPHRGEPHTVFLKPLLATKMLPNISVGDFSYYSSFAPPGMPGVIFSPLDFFENNVRYNYGRQQARLKIGKYCAFADGAILVMADANHSLTGLSTFPFSIFGDEWEKKLPMQEAKFTNKGDIIIGNDVWIGMEAVIMPGVSIGNGAIIGAKALVAKDIPAYAVAVGNPAKVVRMRFPDHDIARLEKIAWWDWPHQHVTNCVPILVKGGVNELEAYAKRNNL